MTELFHKYREIILYIFFGGIAFFLSIGLFILFHKVLRIEALLSNALCWLICVTLQYFTGKLWVFDGTTTTKTELIRQVITFYSGRVFTLIVEEIIIAIFLTWLGLNSVAVKIADNIVSIVMNYIISKKVVFKDRR